MRFTPSTMVMVDALPTFNIDISAPGYETLRGNVGVSEMQQTPPLVITQRLHIHTGSISYLGQDITALPAYRRARIGLVRTFQLASEFRRLTVLENLLSAVPGHSGDSLAGAIRGRRYWGSDELAAIDRAQALLRRFGLLDMAAESYEAPVKELAAARAARGIEEATFVAPHIGQVFQY